MWRKNKKDIKYKLNAAIFPYLVQESLISERVQEKCTDPKCFDYQRKDLLVSAIPQCDHDNYLNKFIGCLRNSVEEAGDAHRELADQLEEDFQEMLISRVSLTEEIVDTTIYDPGKCID